MDGRLLGSKSAGLLILWNLDKPLEQTGAERLLLNAWAQSSVRELLVAGPDLLYLQVGAGIALQGLITQVHRTRGWGGAPANTSTYHLRECV